MSRRSRKLLETRRRVMEELQELANRLNATIYLFGSYARGDHTLDSDIDIIVVSEKFKDTTMAKRAAMIRLLLPSELGFDIIALTPEELEKLKDNAFYRHLSSYWVEIKPQKARQNQYLQDVNESSA